jgi:hypothetical protein
MIVTGPPTDYTYRFPLAPGNGPRPNPVSFLSFLLSLCRAEQLSAQLTDILSLNLRND